MLIEKLLGRNIYRSPEDGAASGSADADGDKGAVKDQAGDGTDGDKGADADGVAAAAKAISDAAAASGGDKGGDKGAAPTWAADWRQKALAEAGVAADDKKTLGMLERYTSPGDIVKKMLEQEKLIRSGELKRPLTKDSTPEQVAVWRKENGVPETADKYDTTLADGLVIGEADKPIVDNMLKVLHGENVSNEVAKKFLSAYFAQEKQFLAGRVEQMAAYTQQQEDALRSSWGNEYRPNDTSIGNLMNTFSEETRTLLADALDSNMMPLMKSAAFKRDLAMIARTINPHDIVTDPSGTSQGISVDDELGEITKLMADSKSAYWKGPLVNGKDTALQARYLQLTSWKEAQKTKK